MASQDRKENIEGHTSFFYKDYFYSKISLIEKKINYQKFYLYIKK